MSRREHAPYTDRHKLGWWIVALLGAVVLWALAVVAGNAAAEALG